MAYTQSLSSPSNPIYGEMNSSQKEIRVLCLASGKPEDTLAGFFILTSCALDYNGVEYEAISYRWGEEKSGGCIKLADMVLDIPPSAEEVLRALRHENRGRNLWIDAVCINQHDDKEKREQVLVMAHVYRGATQTHIWLGKEDENTAKEIACLNEFKARLPPQVQNNLQPLGREEYNNEWRLMQAVLDLGDLNPGPLESFFKREYFRRTWVYQEVVISKICICHIGKETLPWVQVEAVAGLIKSGYGRFGGSLTKSSEEWEIAMALPLAARARRAYRHTALPLAAQGRQALLHERHSFFLSQLVIDARNFLASNPRDHIFGLSALTSWIAIGEYPPVGVKADYTTSEKECFREATRTMINEDCTLIYLELCLEAENRDKRSRDLPSWTPDFKLTDDDRPMCPIPGSDTSAAHNWEPVKMRGPYQENSLILGGFCKGPIRKLLDPFNIVPQHAHPLLQARPQIASWPETLQDRYTPLELVGILLTVLLAGRWCDQPLQQDSVEYKVILQLSVEVLHEIGHARGNLSVILEQQGLRLKTLERLESEMSRICKGRRLFTIEGHMGIGPADMEAKDIVTVLYGSPWPIVLRPTNGYYRLVGPCYVYGIMDGSFIREAKSKGIEPEFFDIR